ncbi:MAG TPA: GrpB family protein [Firmicutes bacterium]|nr:GrpB family protein [Bacillota bacterium]
MRVEVVPYRPEWPEIYRQEAEQIRGVLGGALAAVFHIGSTAVPGLQAKPIIDILPVVFSLKDADAARPALEALGYEWMGELGIPGRRYLRKGGDRRTHQIHIFDAANRLAIERHLAVRDYLREHPDAANAYGALKYRLSLQYPADIEGYCDGKDAFVRELEQRALAWFRQQGRNWESAI